MFNANHTMTNPWTWSYMFSVQKTASIWLFTRWLHYECDKEKCWEAKMTYSWWQQCQTESFFSGGPTRSCASALRIPFSLCLSLPFFVFALSFSPFCRFLSFMLGSLLSRLKFKMLERRSWRWWRSLPTCHPSPFLSSPALQLWWVRWVSNTIHTWHAYR